MAVLFLLEMFIFIRTVDNIIVLFYVVGAFGILYWLACIYRWHTILGQLSDFKYPISPSASVGWHFMPIYNIFWIFYWPWELSHFIKMQKTINIMHGVIIGTFIFISYILLQFDKIVGTMCIFCVGVYINNRLKLHIDKLLEKYPDGIPTVFLEEYEVSTDKKVPAIDRHNNSADNIFTTDEISDMLKVPSNTIREWLRTGKLKGIKTGSTWRIRESDLNAFLANDQKRPI